MTHIKIIKHIMTKSCMLFTQFAILCTVLDKVYISKHSVQTFKLPNVLAIQRYRDTVVDALVAFIECTYRFTIVVRSPNL